MIDALQSSILLKPNILLLSIKRPIDQRGPAFIYGLSPLVNRRPSSKSQRLTYNIYTGSDDSSFGSEKLTKALSDLPIFIDGKDLSIDQWWSKM